MPTRISRRHFLAGFVAVAPTALMLDACGSHHGDTRNARAHAFFTDAESDFVNAAVSRLIPADELGPGAREARVPLFLDIQLAGAYGRAERWYMNGPWPTGTDSQGYQLKFTPAELYRIAIDGIDKYCHGKYGKRFADLTADQQDDVLHALEKDDVKLAQMSSKTFFALLWQNTQEGFLADPVYSGNYQFAGWKLIGFPGPRYNYVDEINQFGKPYEAPFVSLDGRDPDRKSRGA